MGAGASFEENLQNKTDRINAYHKDVQDIINKIEQKSNWLKQTIQQRGYTDKNAICSRIMWQNYDELASFFPVVEVEGVRYKAGTVVKDNIPDALQESKLQTCLNITTLYKKKINLINYILEELPKCIGMENAIYRNLQKRLYSENANTDKWLNIYQKLENFNQQIKKRYTLIYNQLEDIRLAKTIAKIDGVVNTTLAILSDTNKSCKVYESDLIAYSAKDEAKPAVRFANSPSDEARAQAQAIDLSKTLQAQNKADAADIRKALQAQTKYQTSLNDKLFYQD